MKKLVLTAGFFAALLNSSYAYTVMGSASLVKTGTTGSRYVLFCPGQSGICYTNTGGLVEIYLPGGHKFCHITGAPPVLVPKPDGSFTQDGELEVELLN